MLVGSGAQELAFSFCFFGKTGPHLWAGVSPRNEKASSREPEVGEGAECWDGEVGVGWESPGGFLIHWGLTLVMMALSAPVVSGG